MSLNKLLCPAMAAVMAAMAGACGTAKKTPSGAYEPEGTTLPAPGVVRDRGHIIGSEERIAGKAVNHIPRGTVYRMSGDYADNVPVTLSSDGSLASYPAPTDIREGARPIPLADGWWLDRRGVTSSMVFTRYTYAAYSALPQAPAPGEIMQAIIPGARVTALMALPMTTSEAVADTAAVSRWLESQCPAK